jgi:polyisoprenoid-binding protein YceI
METGIQKRNGHLCSKDWLDAETYPKITFNLQNMLGVKIEYSDVSKGRATVSGTANGTISIHGKSKTINAEVTLTYIKESEETKKRAPGDFLSVAGKFNVALEDFDITGAQGIVGSKVGKVINIDFNLFFSSK